MKKESIEYLYNACKEAREVEQKLIEDPNNEELLSKKKSSTEFNKFVAGKINAATSSVGSYKGCFNNLLDNGPVTTAIADDILSYYLEHIKEEFDNLQFRNALLSTQAYIKYRYEHDNRKIDVIRKLCETYVQEFNFDIDFSEHIYDGIVPIKKANEIKSMFELVNLKELRQSIKNSISETFIPADIILADEFKTKYAVYKREHEANVEFFSATAIVTTRNNNKIYIPNQWFVLAAFIAPFVKHINKYKNAIDYLTDNDYPTNDEKTAFYEIIRAFESNEEIQELKHKFIDTLEEYHVFSDFELDDISEKLCLFSTNQYKWWNVEEESNSKKGKNIGRGSDCYFPAALNLLGVVQNTQSEIANIASEFANDDDLLTSITNNSLATTEISAEIENEIIESVDRKKGGQNIIVYGAPGTGKSRSLEDKYSGNNNILKKIVFHPEYTYFDFVGSYKPVPVYKKTSDEFTIVGGESFDKGEPYVDYQFIPGPFVETLILAWNNPSKMVTLLIDEINRANTAAVFGEVFQLLDRKASGESEYKINPSYDLREYIKGIGLGDFISAGLGIPSNMNIVATMNSADQGVFNMDSAFKRRWNFEYKKIDITKANHRSTNIMYAGDLVPWGVFAYAVNEKMKADQMDEDRLIGPFYIKPDELENKKALDKLLLYLWDDVYRHRRKTSDVFLSSVKVFSELTEKFASEDVLLLKNVIDKLYEEDILTTLNIIETSEDETIEDIQDDEKIWKN